MFDERAKILLKTLIERYTLEGQPIGSKTLSHYSGLDLSPASIRNIMAELENLGYITSPHTSAGRIPTALGYRMFIDTLLTVSPLDSDCIQTLQEPFQDNAPLSQQGLITKASHLLSDLTHFAGIVQTPQSALSTIRHIEFIRLSSKRILVILVTTDGNVENRIFNTAESYNKTTLDQAAAYLNAHYSGCDLDTMQRKLSEETRTLRRDIGILLQTMLSVMPADGNESANHVVLSGEKNLLGLSDFSNNISHLRELFDFFEQKSAITRLLDSARQADGVHIFIGGESNTELVNGCSMVTAAYEVQGQIVGAIGVLGPTRMNYERVIPIVDVTAKLLSSALSPA